MANNRMTWMHSGQLGAPQMNGAAGSNGQMLQVLDSALIDGFNPQTVVSATKTATTVTLTFGVSHGYVERQLITVSGATDTVLNGNHRVIGLSTNTVTIDAVGVAVTTGTITTKVAPLGFESIFGSTDPLKRAYRSPNLQGTRTVLYLDMTLPAGHGYNAANPVKRAMVSMCENMTALGTQINSYTDATNNKPAVRNGKMLWYQSRGSAKAAAVTNAVNSDWVIAGDSDKFYMFTVWQNYQPTMPKARDFYAFGDMPSLASDDSFNCAWVGVYNPNDTSDIYLAMNGGKLGGNPNGWGYSGDFGSIGFFIKSKNGVGSLKNTVLSFDGDVSHMVYTGFNDGIQAVKLPNPTSSSLITMPLYFMHSDTMRANAVGLRGVPQHLSNDLALDSTVIDSQLLVAVAKDGLYVDNYGFYAIDLRG